MLKSENRKTRPERLTIRCSKEEKSLINKYAKLVGKNRTQAVIELVRTILIEMEGEK